MPLEGVYCPSSVGEEGGVTYEASERIFSFPAVSCFGALCQPHVACGAPVDGSAARLLECVAEAKHGW